MNPPNIYTDHSTLPGSEVSTAFADRLVTLSDGREGLRGAIHMEVHEPSVRTEHGPRNTPPSDLRENSCNSCLDFICSDETLDRYSEVITAAGWKLDSYHRNPVFQNAHQYGDVIFTLGKALVTEIRAGKLYQRIQFATDVNPMARVAHGLYRGKFLNAVSVGFIPLRWENGTQKTAFSRKYLEQELLEVSAVAIPANPNALALGLKSGALEKSDLRDLADLIRLTLEAPTDQHHRLLSFANSLHAILRS